MNQDHPTALLDRIAVLSRPCDLDLLVFFARHPRAILSSETIAAFLGYDTKDIAESLEALLTAGIVNRTLTSAHAARLYVLAPDGPGNGWLPPFLMLASTRTGRLALLAALRERGARSPKRPSSDAVVKPGPRGIVPRSADSRGRT